MKVYQFKNDTEITKNIQIIWLEITAESNLKLKTI